MLDETHLSANRIFKKKKIVCIINNFPIFFTAHQIYRIIWLHKAKKYQMFRLMAHITYSNTKISSYIYMPHLKQKNADDYLIDIQTPTL